MNEAYFKLWAAQAMGMAPWPDERFPPSPYYRFLRVLAQNLHPELAVELGVCGGGGSFHMAKGNPRGVVVGVEKASVPHMNATTGISSSRIVPTLSFGKGTVSRAHQR